MLSRRIWQKRAFISAQTFFSASASRSSPALPFRFVKPNAPSSPVTLNFARATRYWFSTQPALDLPATKIVDVPLAQTGEGIAECELLKWHVQEGDYVEDFQPLCEVQSDKATIEITSRYKGKVSNILYVPGDIVKVGETLLKMLIDESAFPSTTLGDSENAKSPDSDQTLVNESVSIAVIDDSDNAKSVDSDPGKGRQTGVLSTPAVRSLAKQHGIDINEVCGTGKDGRVLIEDVLNFAVMKGITKNPSTVLHTDSGEQLQGAEGYNYAVTTESYRLSEDRTLPLRGFHRAMVKSMSLAAKVPHFHYVDEINCDALVELKTSFQKNNPSPDVKYTFLPILIKSLSMALVKYPFMNSCFKEDALEVILKGSHNIGIAMATQNGLVVPNIKNVQSLSIMEITKELARLQQLASNNKLTSEDICGGTITLSNIGAIGGKFGSPLINLPEVSIIAIGKIQKVPRFADNGNVYPASLMTVNIGADHRVLDGATVARFCNEWKQLIENPELLTLHLR
ncbi:lipoamide acyltransferase component of branched-chain alpha-keto acid dehydrogenase complex, mitochondrial isoform X1 [Cajanus cajan]|uniref:lipoamide acyltransferase component of branched-chain alpha-keto acid dehydrogenase complex, mitochondrial isoform X1 n=1 Tax=Cajanus cajan TaxID=3821 RepID=UPI00098D9743|nr:lipoamide acyltransferase component of branched-chain alpha-keto acid dehydrogenase complex, mitochondrial isoform X1 [Cajanus cajan]